jgi:hypothetical protein
MRQLAERIGFRAPSIYKHLPGRQALEAATIISAGFELTKPTPSSTHSCSAAALRLVTGFSSAGDGVTHDPCVY